MAWVGGISLQRHGKQKKPALREKSLILSAITKYSDSEIMIDLADDFQVRPPMPIFDKLDSENTNDFLLELAFLLPDWLPCLDDEVEFCIETISISNQRRELCVSNQMVKLAYEVAENPWHVLCPIPAIAVAKQNSELGIPESTFEIPLKSVVSMQFTLKGSTARDAFESQARNCIKELLSCTNRFIVAAMGLGIPNNLPPVLPSYSSANFDAAHFLMRSSTHDDRVIAGRLATNVRHSLRFPYRTVNADDAAIIRRRASGEETIDEIKAILGSAKSYNAGGQSQFSLLLAVIAAEIETSRFFTKYLTKNGTSQNKLDDLEKELTYSMMLNLLPALCPEDMKPNTALMSFITEARKKRNLFMHEGSFSLSDKWVKTILEKTAEYLEFIGEVTKRLSL